MRRAKGRKIDSASGVVYHHEDRPAGEDPKLLEKLTDYFGNYTSEDDMVQKIDSNHITLSENQKSLTAFMGIFGQFDE